MQAKGAATFNSSVQQIPGHPPNQDYREWGGSRYLRMCYWEYRHFFRTTMVSRNERNAIIFAGTMGLVRRTALAAAGDWAEWCVTEDSELAIRVHALGYRSVFVDATYGRGLIPDTFGGYKQQRFRWTYGAVQELKRHWRLFTPKGLAAPSALSAAQKVRHSNHGLDRLNMGLGYLLAPLGIAILVSMVIHQEVVPIPFALWLVASIVLASGIALYCCLCRVAVGCSLRDAAGAFLASQALGHTIAMAALRGLLTRRMAWQRTNKFKSLPTGLRALNAARTELALGLVVLLSATGAVASLPQSGLLIMLTIGVLMGSVTYFAAPVLALLSEHDIRHERQEEQYPAPPAVANVASEEIGRL